MAATGPPPQPTTTAQKLAAINEQTWLTMGNLAEMMTDYEKAMNCYESALRHNPYSIVALTQIASLCRGREQFARAVEYFKRILAIQESNGETWAALGHCYLMMDNLQEAYHAYQQALYHLSNPKDPKLWYGIGILYDRYGSLEHAEEAFSAVMKMDPKFEKANEIYFRLGIIYKQQQKFDLSLQCFQYILQSPPRPLTESDIWFQTGHVYEQQKEYEQAKEAYERVLAENPDHAKVLQQLGWLYHQQNTSFCNQSNAIQYLTRSLKSDSNDAQSWYLLGRCYMAEQNYNKAYEAYQQAVYRDARNPTFWCSIGVLYYQINQYRDALDAYSRAIRLNPYISEVWYDLGTLYESCNNQIQDALDAYQRAAELDPSNPHIKQRLELLRKSQSHTPQTPGSAPTPQDVSNPSQYQSGPNAQPLNGPAYGQSQAPSGPPSGMSAYHTGPTPPQQRSVEERGPPPPHLPMSLPPHEASAGPGRDLPMPSGPPPPPQQHQQQQQQQHQHQQPPAASGRRSPGLYPPSSYPAPTTREDVRIPDIGSGGGRAPTPSDRSQMNPIMQDNGRSSQSQHPSSIPSGPPPPPGSGPHAAHNGGQPGSGLPNLHQSPFGKPPNASEGLRSPNVSGDNARPHLVSPRSRPSASLHHASSPKQYDAPPSQQQQHHHHRSPAPNQSEHQHHQQPPQGYEMAPPHADYDHAARQNHPSGRPITADSHYASTRPDILPHSPSPTTYSRLNHASEPSYHRGPPSAPISSDDSADMHASRQQHHNDIKQEYERPPLRSPNQEPPSPAQQQQQQQSSMRDVRQHYSHEPHHQASRREPERYDHHQQQHHSTKESTTASRTPGGRAATDDDYDASAADMLLSIGQSRGDKRVYPDETKDMEETKRIRSNSDDKKDSDHPMANAPTTSLSPPRSKDALHQQTPSAEDTQKPPMFSSSTPPTKSTSPQPPTASMVRQSTSLSPPSSTPPPSTSSTAQSAPPFALGTPSPKSSPPPSKPIETHEQSPVSSSPRQPAEPVKNEEAVAVEEGEATTPPAQQATPAQPDSATTEPDTKDDDEEEEEGELRDEATSHDDAEMIETKTDEKEEGEVTSGIQEDTTEPQS